MGMLRTINHPGIEIQEVDMSGSTDQVGGTTTLVMGFFPQGESGKAVNPTTMASVKSYFGTPENEAERYAYYACKTVFDNGGKLVAARIPYNNNSQYLTPAVKYGIEEWATKHVKTYEKDPTARRVVNQMTAEYVSTEAPNKFDFVYDGDNDKGIGIYAHERLVSKNGDGTEPRTETVSTTISSTEHPAVTSNVAAYYTLRFNDFDVVSSGSYSLVSTGTRTITAVVDEYSLNSKTISGDVNSYADLLALGTSEGTVYRVIGTTTVEASGMYLNGTYAAHSCFEYINHTGHQRIIHTDNSQIYLLFLCKISQLI